MDPRHGTPEERFWRHVDRRGNNECWNWMGFKNSQGYGRFNVNGTNGYSHRISYELFCSSIEPGMFIIHTCDNPSCVNPKHLLQGSHLDNMQDMKSKHRNNHPVGERNGRAKLTWDQVKDIRQRYDPPSVTYQSLGKEYGLSEGGFYKVICGTNWKE